MTARPRRTTTLVGPSRLALAAATGGLVALASAGTALLVLTGTSAVSPAVSAAPPLPTTAPRANAPGVVVVPTPASHAARPRHTDGRAALRPAVVRPSGPVPSTAPVVALVAPAALAFSTTDAVPAPVVAVPAVVTPALRREPVPVVEVPARHGRHLAKGHRRHSNGHVAPRKKHTAAKHRAKVHHHHVPHHVHKHA